MTRPKNPVLIVSNMYPDRKYPFYGTFVKNFCKQLESIQVDYKLAVMTKKSSPITKAAGYIIFYIKTFFLCMFGKYEYIYIHYASYSSLPVLLAAKIRRLRVLVNVHGSDVFPLKAEHRAMNGVTKRIIGISENIIVPSLYFKDVVAEKYSFPREKIVVYPSGGVDRKIFYEYLSNKKEQLRIINQVDVKKTYIGFVSRMDKAKGWDTYVNAAKIVIEDGYECGFLMVGSGPDDGLVSEMIADLGLGEVIKRYPQQPPDVLPDYYNMMDVFVFPTVAASESLGLVAIEAMACGCPVIGSDYAAPGTYIINEENGLKFPKGDHKALARCIERYLDYSNEKRMEMKLSAVETADRYDSEKIKGILMKVLMVGNHPSNGGGMTSVISQLLGYDWERKSIEMKFIPTYIPGNTVEKSLFFAVAYMKILTCIIFSKPDIVHMHMSCRGSFFRKYMIHQLCKIFGVKDIVHLHGSEFKDYFMGLNRRKKRKVKKLLREVDTLFVLGKNWERTVYEIESKANIVVLNNTVKIPEKMVVWNDRVCQFLYLGVLIKRKGVDDLIEAVNILERKGKIGGIHFVIAGAGDEEKNLKRKCDGLGLNEYVSFTGWVSGSEKYELILKSQVAVLPSYAEGLPISILESISYGMPVIATDVGDISMAVQDNKNGYLIHPGDVAGLADKIEKLCNRYTFENMSRISRKIAEENFSDEQYCETVKNYYLS